MLANVGGWVFLIYYSRKPLRKGSILWKFQRIPGTYPTPSTTRLKSVHICILGYLRFVPGVCWNFLRITSWWLNHPFETYSSTWVKIFPNFRGENNTYLKPPPRSILWKPTPPKVWHGSPFKTLIFRWTMLNFGVYIILFLSKPSNWITKPTKHWLTGWWSTLGATHLARMI